MAKMYVANCSKQRIDFIYRAGEGTAPRMIPIGIGQQVLLEGRDISPAEVDTIVEHHRQYGMVAVDEIDRSKNFVGICYSIDKPIKPDSIMRAVRQNTGVLQEMGRKIRQESAVAQSGVLEQNLEDSGVGGRVREFEATIIEEKPENRDTSESPAVAEGVIVSREGESTGRPASSRGRRQRGG